MIKRKITKKALNLHLDEQKKIFQRHMLWKEWLYKYPYSDCGTLVGIVPACEHSSFGLPYADNLVPVAENYLAVERAIAECAFAGCSIIFVVVPQYSNPVLLKRIGRTILDPRWIIRRVLLQSRLKSLPEQERKKYREQISRWFFNPMRDLPKYIQIFYVGMPIETEINNNPLLYGITSAASFAKEMCGSISKWLAPSSYYVAFPQSSCDPLFVLQARKIIYDNYQKNILFQNKGKTVLDGLPIPFIFKNSILKELEKIDFQSSEFREKSDTTRVYAKQYEMLGKYLKKAFFRQDSYIDETVFGKYFHCIHTWKNYLEYYKKSPFPKYCRSSILNYHYSQEVRLPTIQGGQITKINSSKFEDYLEQDLVSVVPDVDYFLEENSDNVVFTEQEQTLEQEFEKFLQSHKNLDTMLEEFEDDVLSNFNDKFMEDNKKKLAEKKQKRKVKDGKKD